MTISGDIVEELGFKSNLERWAEFFLEEMGECEWNGMSKTLR